MSFCVVGGELRTSLTQCLPPFCPAGADNHGKRRAKPDRWKKRKVEKRTVTYQTVTAFSKEEELTKKKKPTNSPFRNCRSTTKICVLIQTPPFRLTFPFADFSCRSQNCWQMSLFSLAKVSP